MRNSYAVGAMAVLLAFGACQGTGAAEAPGPAAQAAGPGVIPVSKARRYYRMVSEADADRVDEYLRLDQQSLLAQRMGESGGSPKKPHICSAGDLVLDIDNKANPTAPSDTGSLVTATVYKLDAAGSFGTVQVRRRKETTQEYNNRYGDGLEAPLDVVLVDPVARAAGLSTASTPEIRRCP